ncbi:hypothetical protein BJ508DRAFT_328860 [Ascobolus immersus RN42]|uniref:Uncharacterized protein n=1 Tax=Ascobolus immersus RN42 TaxID=1160509 RepID=A0A3N4HY90_ASCIM|nr:hypothetical protein BJ508DRAFT_328860 [Ascobolus immersus RN42]
MSFLSAPEISDDWLRAPASTVQSLKSLYFKLVECKNVTSGGLAYSLRELSQKLSSLCFLIYMDNRLRFVRNEVQSETESELQRATICVKPSLDIQKPWSFCIWPRTGYVLSYLKKEYGIK